MTDTIPVTVRMPSDKIAILDKIASEEDRSRNYLLNQAFDSYIEMRRAWVEGIEKAQKEVAEGKVLPFESVMTELLEDLLLEIKITHSARLDLLEIKSYLKENFPDAVKPTLLKLQEYIEQLELFSQSGVESSVKDVKELKTSKLPYVIVYSVNGNVLEILRIYHTSRKPILHWR